MVNTMYVMALIIIIAIWWCAPVITAMKAVMNTNVEAIVQQAFAE